MLCFTQDMTTISVVGDSTVMRASRFIKHRLCAINMKLDGTIGDLAKKINNVNRLSDSMFEEFDRIQREEGE